MRRGFVVAEKAYAVVDENHRALVTAWLNRQGNLKNIVVGPLRDAWYGWG
ncbi:MULTISPECIES: 50S ribosome-binding protein YggL [unclassified Duganella]